MVFKLRLALSSGSKRSGFGSPTIQIHRKHRVITGPARRQVEIQRGARGAVREVFLLRTAQLENDAVASSGRDLHPLRNGHLCG